jgi:DNA mismatch repair protein MutL
MGNRIAVLPDIIANKIAAGEVIQRPESVAKELLENSLDAGATRILLLIKEGGKNLIQVSDNGAGMDEQDAVMSFLRHATSKIASYEDLEEIRTYGFRGEALASIAAVAQVTMKTRRPEDDAAVVVRTEGGGTPQISREGREPGTLISVHNLFFNVPARRKFLKSASTEFRHIYDVVVRTAMSRPDIALKFLSDNETIFNLEPSPLADRVVDLFGQRQFDSLIPVQEKGPVFVLSGYISKPSFGQRTRVNQFLFLNRRYIVNRNINHAVFSTYEHLLAKGTFPFFVLFLDVDPRRIDVNVHPSKLEAKFEDEQSLYRFVAGVARKALGEAVFIPALTLPDNPSGGDEVSLRFSSRQHSWPGGAPGGNDWEFPTRVDTKTGEILGGTRQGGREMADQLLKRPDAAQARLDAPAGPAGGVQPAILNETAEVWQLHRKYILCPIENGVMVIDQHVAHERVLYERAMQRFANAVGATQHLLFPRTIQVTAGEYALLQELLPQLAMLGFEIKLFGKNTFVLEGVPPDVPKAKEASIVSDVLALYQEYQQAGPLDVRENLAKSFACRSAVMAGDALTEPEMRSLIEQLGAAQMPYVCPHGRPVMLRISIDELDRRFGRS